MTGVPEAPYYGVKRHQIDEFEASCRDGAPWLIPIARALHCGCGHLIVTQHAGPFRIPRKARLRPTITTLGDDIFEALGTGAFHLPSVRRVLRAATAVAVVSGPPVLEVYRAIAVHAAVRRQHAVIVETRIEQEIPWLQLISKTAPKLPILLSTVRGGTA